MQHTYAELLTEIEKTLFEASGEAKNRRVQTLERLVKAKVADEDRDVNVLCEVIARLGAVQPEFTLVTKCLAKITRSEGPGLDKLAFLIEQKSKAAIHCGCHLVLSLRGNAQVRLARLLAMALIQMDAMDSLTEDLVRRLQQLKSPGSQLAVAEELAGCLDSPDSLKIRNAVTVLAEIADKSVERGMINVLRKLFKGYYQNHAPDIKKSLCSYLARVKSKAAVPLLLRGIEDAGDRCFATAVGAICDYHPEVQEDLLRLFKKAIGKPKEASIKVECVRALSTLKKEKPHVTKLARIFNYDDLRYDSLRADFRDMLLKNQKASKPVLLGMIQSHSEVQYEFALEVLKEMHVPIEEVETAIGANPVVAIYKYFFEVRASGLGLRALWEAKDKLGEEVRGKTTKFEHLLRHLLSCLGFITLDVDASGKKGVDTVAFAPTWSCVLVVGSTTGGISKNLQDLADISGRLRTALGVLARKIEIVPVVATSMAGETHPNDTEYARKHGILVLRESDIDRIVSLVNTNRSYKEFLAYLEGKAGKAPAQSLLEALERSAKRIPKRIPGT